MIWELITSLVVLTGKFRNIAVLLFQILNMKNEDWNKDDLDIFIEIPGNISIIPQTNKILLSFFSLSLFITYLLPLQIMNMKNEI